MTVRASLTRARLEHIRPHAHTQHWHGYDTSKAWFWNGKKAAKKAPRLA